MEALVCFALAAFFPREGELPGLAELGLEEQVAKLRRESPLLFWTGLVGAALFFQLSPILTVKKPLLAAMLSADELDEHAHRVATLPVYAIRQTIVLLKLTGGVLWGQSPEVRAFLSLPAYGADPGTRRTERMVSRPVHLEREPSPRLVPLGRREEARGRTVTRAALLHGLDVDHREDHDTDDDPARVSDRQEERA